MRLEAITDKDELARLMRQNNPEGEQVGHYTGRCMNCGSKDLWDDFSAYGCNCCGALFMVGDMPPRLVCNHCHVTFEMGESHTCSAQTNP